MDNKTNLSIEQLFEQVEKELLRLGYGNKTLKRYKTVWKHLLNYINTESIESYTVKTGMNFLEKAYNITIFKNLTNENKTRARAVNVLNDFYLHGVIYPRYITSSVSLLSFHSDILKEFQESRKQSQISNSTLETYNKHLGKFLFFLEKHGINNLSQITTQIILDYCNTFAGYTSGVTHNNLSSLRVFLHFLYQRSILADDFAPKVPRIIYRRDANIPSAFPKNDVQKILDAVDRGNPIGKRDYSILLLASELGLRSSDIRNLRFPNIHWEKNTIELTMCKTGKAIILPLMKNIGMAIIDYIKHGRPHADTDIIFLRHVSPIQNLTGAAMTFIVKRYISLSGIAVRPGQSQGPHAMRHSLASALLEDNVPLPVISEILGHADSRTTSIYLKIDINQLKNCALEVPEFDWNKGKEVF